MFPRTSALAAGLSSCMLLASCGSGPPAIPFTRAGPDDPGVVACNRTSFDDPAVKAAIVARTASASTTADTRDDEVEVLRKRAFLRCLRASGLAPRGGVEPVKRPSI